MAAALPSILTCHQVSERSARESERDVRESEMAWSHGWALKTDEMVLTLAEMHERASSTPTSVVDVPTHAPSNQGGRPVPQNSCASSALQHACKTMSQSINS